MCSACNTPSCIDCSKPCRSQLGGNVNLSTLFCVSCLQVVIPRIYSFVGIMSFATHLYQHLLVKMPSGTFRYQAHFHPKPYFFQILSITFLKMIFFNSENSCCLVVVTKKFDLKGSSHSGLKFQRG